jgi:hypothetical protein
VPNKIHILSCAHISFQINISYTNTSPSPREQTAPPKERAPHFGNLYYRSRTRDQDKCNFFSIMFLKSISGECWEAYTMNGSYLLQFNFFRRWTCSVKLPLFRCKMLTPPSGSLALKMEGVWSSKPLASTDKSTLRYSPEDQHKQLHSRDNLKYHTIKFVRHYKAEVFLWQTTD